MEDVTDKHLNDVKHIIELYIDLIENQKESFMYYLSEGATLDWFGHTVKGQKNISSFIKSNVSTVKHQFDSPKPALKIGYRDTHVVKRITGIKIDSVTADAHEFKEVKDESKETPSTPSSSHHHFVEKGQGDGLHNCDLPVSPAKKLKLDTTGEELSVKYISAEGTVQFQKRSNKKLQRETKWRRPCKLEFAYSGTSSKDFTVYLIIYEGNTKCRRNLLKDFEANEPSD